MTNKPTRNYTWLGKQQLSLCVCVYHKASETLLTKESRQILLKTCTRLLKLYTITFTEAQTHERVTLWRQLSVGESQRIVRGAWGVPYGAVFKD